MMILNKNVHTPKTQAVNSSEDRAHYFSSALLYMCDNELHAKEHKTSVPSADIRRVELMRHCACQSANCISISRDLNFRFSLAIIHCHIVIGLRRAE